MNKKRFIENSILMTVFAVIIYYTITFLYSFFKELDINISDLDFNVSIPTVDTNILLNKYIVNKNNEVNISKTTTKVTDKSLTEAKNTVIQKAEVVVEPKIIKKDAIVKKVIEKIEVKQVIKKEIIQKKAIIKAEEKKVIKKEIEKKKVIKKIENKQVDKKVKETVTKDKKIMLEVLRKYIKDAIIATRNNVNVVNNLQNNESSVKIRVTVLGDGSQQNIKYLSGNKELMKEAKMAIKKTFPREISQNIKTQFPRYLRFKIEFKGE